MLCLWVIRPPDLICKDNSSMHHMQTKEFWKSVLDNLLHAMQCLFLCMKHALEQKLWMGLDSERQKKLALCRDTLKGVLERLSSQFDEMDRKLCMGRELCFPDKGIAGMQWSTKFVSPSVDKWFSGNNFLVPCCNSNISKLSKQTPNYCGVPSEQWSLQSHIQTIYIPAKSLPLAPWAPFRTQR